MQQIWAILIYSSDAQDMYKEIYIRQHGRGQGWRYVNVWIKFATWKKKCYTALSLSLSLCVFVCVCMCVCVYMCV